MKNIISVKNFSKSFGKTQVLHDLNFEVEKGELFAYLGANGSGKTTTIRCLLDIYHADAGELLINGVPYSVDQSHLIGYLPEERGLYVNSTVLDTMVYFGEIKGMTRYDARQAALDFLKSVDLLEKQNLKIKSLSSGQQQKIQLGITIINKPSILILDEPTKGLDPVNRQLLLELLKELNTKHGSTIMFSTHQMDEVEKIADRLMMLKDGSSVLYGKVNDVRKEFGENIIQLDYTGKLPENKKLFSAAIEKNYAEINPHDGVSEKHILEYLMSTGIEIKRFEITSPSLNEIFIKVASK